MLLVLMVMVMRVVVVMVMLVMPPPFVLLLPLLPPLARSLVHGPVGTVILEALEDGQDRRQWNTGAQRVAYKGEQREHVGRLACQKDTGYGTHKAWVENTAVIRQQRAPLGRQLHVEVGHDRAVCEHLPLSADEVAIDVPRPRPHKVELEFRVETSPTNALQALLYQSGLLSFLCLCMNTHKSLEECTPILLVPRIAALRVVHLFTPQLEPRNL
jgi:hypothetical protein